MAKHYYSGESYHIQDRLKCEGRNCDELICVQFRVESVSQEIPGWRPLPHRELWPVCPLVGDTFMMKSYWYREEESQEEDKVEYKQWMVISRVLMSSGPRAREMNGIVLLTVELEITQ